jgi:hypothetical protein
LVRATSDAVTQDRLHKLAGEHDAQADAEDGADDEAPTLRRPGRDDDDP